MTVNEFQPGWVNAARADRTRARQDGGVGWHRLVGVALLLLVLLASAGHAVADEPLSAADALPKISSLKAGFAGRFKVGYWTPLVVTITGGSEPASGRIEVTVPDGEGVPSRVHVPADGELTVPAGETIQVPLTAKFGRLKCEVTVAFRHDDQLLASAEFDTAVADQLGGIMPAGQELVVAVGPALSADNELPTGERRAALATVDGLKSLPEVWWGYEGVTAVMLIVSRAELAAELTAESPQLNALDQWVRQGGRLILNVAGDGSAALAAGSALSGLAPGAFAETVPLRSSTPLETYAETTEPLDTSGSFLMRVTRLTDARGQIDAFAGSNPRDLPLVVRTPRGFGEVVFVGFDLTYPGLVSWPARSHLFERLLHRTIARNVEHESTVLGEVATLGFVDLAGQLRGALDQFSGVFVVPFWLVAALVVLYIALIGPFDYFLVKRFLGRMEATWITFGLIVVSVSAGAMALAYGLKGHELRMNQLDIVDFDAESNLVRGTTWASLFSPRIDSYDLSVTPQPPQNAGDGAGLLLSWMGVPGNGFGSMNPPGRNVPLFTETYDFSGRLDRLEHVPIAIWSSRAFVARWWRQAAPGVEAQLTDNGRLSGTLHSSLDEKLTDGVVIFDRWAYPLRELKPSETVNIESRLEAQTIDTYLKKARAEGDKNVVAAYDRASFDIPQIVQMMSAYELAGGERYARLGHEYQGYLDLSGQVKSGRAVFIARVERRGATVERDGQPIEDPNSPSWTYYRYVFPVQPGKR